ncbi:hypothetical protein LCGC14_1399700 [marine sediment metagenome]|uniref:Uncharacterized protein n=1 Tax=marine sediment metagenome TaxID=412755 RepID=A0A0F9MD09_9ZZZZ
MYVVPDSYTLYIIYCVLYIKAHPEPGDVFLGKVITRVVK